MIITKKQRANFILVLCIFGLVVFPKTILAASVYFTSSSHDIYPGDVFVIEAKISSPAERINVADGAFLFDHNALEVKELSTGGSTFSLWARAPTFSNEAGQISFIGGTPEGFQGENKLMLKAIFLAKKEGGALLNFQDDFSLFLGDGRGSKINPQRKQFVVHVLKRPPEVTPKNEWRSFIKEDKAPPEFIEAIISRDPHIFNNQYFVSFFATDKESGVAYYKVKEGDRDFVSAENPYLLQDQSLKSIVQIKAIDKAGNESIITPKLAPVPIPEISYKIYLIWILVVLAILILIFWLWRLWMTKLRKNIQK